MQEGVHGRAPRLGMQRPEAPREGDPGKKGSLEKESNLF
jgi:hypothetical protein